MGRRGRRLGSWRGRGGRRRRWRWRSVGGRGRRAKGGGRLGMVGEVLAPWWRRWCVFECRIIVGMSW